MKAFVYSDVSSRNSLVLEIDGKKYAVTQYVASWAANEIPTAACMVAIGREARTGKPATVHTDSKYQQMVKARVLFFPNGEYSPTQAWPDTEQVIFDGFFTGFAYRKISGKVQTIANLIHWLAALGFSSALTKAGHVANPTQLNAASILPHLGSPSGGGQGNYISALVPGSIVATDVSTDLWKSIKSMFCGLASVDLMATSDFGACEGTGQIGNNSAALSALRRIEGPSNSKNGDCSRAYKWGVPLKLKTNGISRVEDAVSDAIGLETVDGYSHTTFWDKLVGTYCPMFGMAIVPMVNTAILIADTPAYNGDYWKEITPNDYDAFDMSGELQRPLRGVGVISTYAAQTMANQNRIDKADQIVGGCYMEDSVAPGDGAVLYVAPPIWLNGLHYLPGNAGSNSGVGPNKPVQTATTPPTETKPKDTTKVDVSSLYSNFAHAVYVTNMLRGRGGVASGKLRFDIAPGSVVRIRASSTKFIGAEDDLAVTQFAAVQRVTVAINAESAMAGTTLAFSHLRTEIENVKPRTSVSEHPLFGKSIHGGGKHGSPLIDAYNL